MDADDPGDDIRPSGSPNPGGRPRNTPEMKEAKKLAKAATPDVVRRLITIATSSDDEKAAIMAGNSILDRAFGKPAQAIALDVEHKGDPATPELVRAELMRLLAPLAPKVVESTAEEVARLPAKDPA